MRRIIMSVGLGVILVGLTGIFQVKAEEIFHVVTYNRLPNDGGKPVPLIEGDLKKEYGIIEHHYFPPGEDVLELMKKRATGKGVDISIEDWKVKYKDDYKPVDNSFIDNLSKAKLLYFSKWCGSCSQYLFNRDEYANAVSEFLKKGGTVFFDFNSANLVLTPYLDSIHVKNPASSSSDTTVVGDYVASVSPEYKNHALVNNPYKILGTVRGYNWFWKKNCSEEQILLFVDSVDSNKVAMVVQENVLGKGTIIFTQLYPIFGKEHKELLENILSYVYGQNIRKYKQKRLEEAGGPGESVEF